MVAEDRAQELVGAHDAKLAVEHRDVTRDAFEQDLMLALKVFALGDVGCHGEDVGHPAVVVGHQLAGRRGIQELRRLGERSNEMVHRALPVAIQGSKEDLLVALREDLTAVPGTNIVIGQPISHRIDQHVPRDEPMIIAGDFNDWRRRAENHLHDDLNLEELFVTLQGRHARTFPVWAPMLPVDRVYFRGLNPVSCRRLATGHWRDLSDHAALFGEFELR